MIFDLIFIGLTLTTIGEILLGVAVLLVHQKVRHDHGIDGPVLKEIKREKNITILAIILIIIGYILQIEFFNLFF